MPHVDFTINLTTILTLFFAISGALYKTHRSTLREINSKMYRLTERATEHETRIVVLEDRVGVVRPRVPLPLWRPGNSETEVDL